MFAAGDSAYIPSSSASRTSRAALYHLVMMNRLPDIYHFPHNGGPTLAGVRQDLKADVAVRG
ncbi:MAG: hypothetical protein FJ405_14535 [Verrucomicrobia bacterium]|nr:hypothetical protein [Verrucomicrobiota bacterium]